MRDYRAYTIEDFSVDADFRSWVNKPTPVKTAYWEEVMLKNPELKETILEAVAILTAVKELATDDLTAEVRAEEIRNMFVRKQQTKTNSRLPGITLSFRWYKIAAIWLVLIGLGSLYYFLGNKQFGKSASITLSPPDRSEKMITKTNQSGRASTVLLSDGSIILLENGSVLQYPEKFTSSERRIILQGNAFFDVVKDTTKPFLVYSETTVTRVLGTSFRIKSTDNQVLVAVKTGKVSVQKMTDFQAGLASANEGVLLNPNQQVVYHSKDELFEKSEVKNPPKIISDSDKWELGFEEALVSDIFRALEKNYGIDIEFDESRFSHCRLTTQFTDETLRQRLQAICQVTGAAFTIMDGQVLITGTCE
jgi:transmembrane sensor